MKFAETLAGTLTLPVAEAARRLVGMRIRTAFPDGVTEVILTEVEAYGGLHDPASHAYRGPTRMNASMFGPPGTLYVYRSYGIHWCMNIVTAPAGEGEAILLRAGEPVEGREVMVRRRGRTSPLADGPGKLARALGVTGEHDGTDIFTGPVRLLQADEVPGRVLAAPRVGISRARDTLWRFVLAEPVRKG